MTDSPGSESPQEPSPGGPTEQLPEAPTPSGSGAGMGSLWVSCLLAGFLAGLVSWFAGELTNDWFPAELREGKDGMGRPIMVPTKETLEVSMTRTALLSSALLGGTLGVFLGLAGGLSRRSVRSAVWAGLLGLVLGTAAGLGATFGLIHAYIQTRGEAHEEVAPSLLIHMGIWSGLGAAAGLALGLGLHDKRRTPRALLGGAVGAALGAALYEIVGCVAFPLARTTQLISVTWETRLMARLLVCLFAAIGVVVFLIPAKAKPPKKSPSVPD